MDPKNLGLVAGAVALALGIHAALLWKPERQVRLHQLHLLQSVERRDWPRFIRFIDDEYSDAWQHDKSFVTKATREVFRNFIWVTIVQRNDIIRVGSGSATVTAALVVAGNGGPFGEAVKQRVNGCTEPFLFRWRKNSWKPWDWQLVGFEQRELELSEF